MINIYDLIIIEYLYIVINKSYLKDYQKYYSLTKSEILKSIYIQTWNFLPTNKLQMFLFKTSFFQLV